MSRLTVGIVFFLGALGAILFVVVPQWNTIGGLRAEIIELEQFSEELTAFVAQRDALLAEYNAISQSELEKIQSLAPVGRNTSAVLVDFEALARQTNVALDQVDFAGAEQPKALAGTPVSRYVSPLPVSMNLRGSYPAFRQFLVGLEKNLRIFDTTDIAFSGEGDRVITVTLRGKIYYQ